MKPTFRLTPRAYDDLKNIARHTLQQWGEAQRHHYLSALDERFGWLAEHPYRGKHRPDIHNGYYCFPHASHLIFYLIRTDGIDIIGVPHKRMDALHHLSDQENQ